MHVISAPGAISFNVRGRGRPLDWTLKHSGSNNLPKPGPICIGKRNELSIVYSKGRGGGKCARVVFTEKNPGGEGSVGKQVATLKCKTLLDEGVFAAPSDDQSLINRMPDRVLRKIFSFITDSKTFTSCESVCRRWKILTTMMTTDKTKFEKQDVKILQFEVCKTKSLECVYEKNKKPNNGGRDSYDYYRIICRLPIYFARQSYVVDVTRKIFQKFHVVSTLAFVNLEIDETLLRLLVNLQKNVKQLRFLRCLIDGNALASLAPIRGIKELAIDHCYGYGDAISTKSILPLMERNVFNRLELCGATALTQVDDAVVEALLLNWKHHKFDFLKLHNCPNITTTAISKVVNHYVQSDKKKLILFLQKTGFEIEAFLKNETSFVQSLNVPTTRRVCLKSASVLIWVEK